MLIQKLVSFLKLNSINYTVPHINRSLCVCQNMTQTLTNAFEILLISFSQSAWTSDDQIHTKGGFIGNRNHVSFIFLGY